jgi:hypothetical protein
MRLWRGPGANDEGRSSFVADIQNTNSGYNK